MVKIFFSVFSLLVFVLLNTSQINAQDSKWYLGAGIGASEIESDIVLWTILSPDYLDHQERDLGFKFLGGYKINEYTGLELSYVNFGDMSVKANAGAFITSENVVWGFTQNDTLLDVDVETISVGSIFFLPLDKLSDKKFLKCVTPFFKLGLHYWNIDKSLTQSNSINYYVLQFPVPNPGGPLNHVVEDDSGLGWFYGIGFDFKINKRVSIFFSYEWYSFQEKMIKDADFISSVIVIKF